jgi:hypothetical protein
MRILMPLLALLPAALSGCDALTCDRCGLDCPAIAIPSVALTVVDSGGNPVSDVEATWSAPGGLGGDCEMVDEDDIICAWGVGGEVTITADALGYEAASTTVQVQEDECNVETEEVTLVLDPVLCDDGLDYAVHVTTEDAEGNVLTDASVEAMPLGAGWTGAEACVDRGDGSHDCLEEWGGEIEVWASHPTAGTAYEVVDVPIDDCGAVTQGLVMTLTR